jgi:hypothetical protein
VGGEGGAVPIGQQAVNVELDPVAYLVTDHSTYYYGLGRGVPPKNPVPGSESGLYLLTGVWAIVRVGWRATLAEARWEKLLASHPEPMLAGAKEAVAARRQGRTEPLDLSRMA